jgi:hypothetical protein
MKANGVPSLSFALPCVLCELTRNDTITASIGYSFSDGLKIKSKNNDKQAVQSRPAVQQAVEQWAPDQVDLRLVCHTWQVMTIDKVKVK